MIPDEVIISKIYLIRGLKVMLDLQLAELYGIETRRLNEQVKRNLDRFPADFMFQLNQEEYKNLKSHFAISSWGEDVNCHMLSRNMVFSCLPAY